MPELPEVETTCRSIIPYAIKQKFTKVIIRQQQLRWPIFAGLAQVLPNQTIQHISRRAKYILFTCTKGTLIIHLGMSGKLSVVQKNIPAAKHDHVDFILSNNYMIRYTDPRRFGSIHWTASNPNKHRLLANLGIEPLGKEFSGAYLFAKSKNKRTPIKSFLMNAAIVVGIGNIYANEALFFAGIMPNRAVNTIDLAEYTKLAKQVKLLLQKAIRKGGATLNYNGKSNVQDFFNIDGTPGYFFQDLMVYGRAGEVCYKCKTILQSIRLNQRTTVFCPKCQH